MCLGDNLELVILLSPFPASYVFATIAGLWGAEDRTRGLGAGQTAFPVEPLLQPTAVINSYCLTQYRSPN